MRTGDSVNLYSGGERQSATVAEISGAGESRKKILTLAVGSGDKAVKYADVKHREDAEEGEPFWTLKGDSVQRELREATAEPEVIEEPAEAAETPKRRK